ncbi:hypothetical protein EXIGLDRAFT_834464 [Exidia glandulosa HHB12029]|uniref:Uncharacterized protein n=1 Tax=Exidia glandulosa HHB12029 TaxID=1314781 RepID=A0A165JQS4_EXIGL|nr:hypothetical protein EXIGLDRAFT_834464 [Exidia glandulosa HHB12029]
MSILDVLVSDVPQLIATLCFIFTLPDVAYGADFRCLFLSMLLGMVLGLYLTQRAYGIKAPRQRLFACLFLLGASILTVVSYRFCVSCLDRVHGARALNFAFMFMLATRVAAIYFPPVQSLALDSRMRLSRTLYGSFVVVAVTGLVFQAGSFLNEPATARQICSSAPRVRG